MGSTWDYASDYERAEAERLDGRLEAIADRLRDMTATVERHRTIRPNITTMEPDYTRAAVDVIHELTWGFANLHLDGLADVAADTTAARVMAQGEEGG